MWVKAECRVPLKAGVLNGDVVSGCVVASPGGACGATISLGGACGAAILHLHHFLFFSVAAPAAPHYIQFVLELPAPAG
eukprot:gene5746-biopygen17763